MMYIMRMYSLVRIIKYFCFLLVLLFPLSALAQPKIVFEEEVHTFGEVMQGEDIEHTFVFRNEGNEELNIEKVSPS